MPVGIRAAQLESNRKQSAITASDSGRDIYKQLKTTAFTFELQTFVSTDYHTDLSIYGF